MSDSASTTPVYRQRRDKAFAIYSPLIKPLVCRLQATFPATLEARELEQIGAVALLCIVDHLESYIHVRVKGAILDSVRAGAADKRVSSQRFAKCISIDDVSENAAELSVGPEPIVETIDAKRRSQRVLAAVDALPGPEKQVIAAKLSGASSLEIARTLDVTTRHVRRQKASAIARLRISLAA